MPSDQDPQSGKKIGRISFHNLDNLSYLLKQIYVMPFEIVKIYPVFFAFSVGKSKEGVLKP
jgi:hypothetical protein